MTFVAIPNIGNIRAELVEFMLRQKGIEYYLPQNRPHDVNRNVIVKRFLTTEHEWLLMVDSDVVPPDNVLEMVNNNLDVCSAWVCTSKDGETIPLAMEKVDGGYKCFSQLYNGVNAVDALGTGCLLLNRRIFDKLPQPYFSFVKDSEGLLANGEDFDFCDKLRAVGIQPYFDARFKCKHYVNVFV
jgi:GT2 family glycosyltransferase